MRGLGGGGRCAREQVSQKLVSDVPYSLSSLINFFINSNHCYFMLREFSTVMVVAMIVMWWCGGGSDSILVVMCVCVSV